MMRHYALLVVTLLARPWCLVALAAFSQPKSSLQDQLLSRRTINDFEPQLPNYWEYHLERAIEAATYAPNHKRTEPWRFHLLGPQSIRRVCQLNAELVAASKGAAAGAAKRDRWLAIPGWLVVTQAASERDDGPTQREDYAACCCAVRCAVQNLCLSLHANGIGTKWTTGPVHLDPRFAPAVGLPEDETVVGTVWFGRPAGRPPAAPKKRPLNEVFFKHD